MENAGEVGAILDDAGPVSDEDDDHVVGELHNWKKALAKEDDSGQVLRQNISVALQGAVELRQQEGESF